MVYQCCTVDLFWRFLMHWVPCAGGRWACILAVSSYCTSARLNRSVDAVTFEEEKVGICSILQPDMQHLFRDSMKTSALMEALYCFAWQCQAQIIQQWRALQHRKLSWKAMAAFALLESISMAICAEVCSSVEGVSCPGRAPWFRNSSPVRQIPLPFQAAQSI